MLYVISVQKSKKDHVDQEIIENILKYEHITELTVFHSTFHVAHFVKVGERARRMEMKFHYAAFWIISRRYGLYCKQFGQNAKYQFEALKASFVPEIP